MAKKFISYQHLLLMDISSALPEEMRDFFEDHVTKCEDVSLGEGSLIQTHVDSSDLLELRRTLFVFYLKLMLLRALCICYIEDMKDFLTAMKLNPLHLYIKHFILALHWNIYPWYMKGSHTSSV